MPSSSLILSRRWPALLAWLALGMNLLAGAGLAAPAPASERGGSAYFGDVCSSHGATKAPTTRGDSTPAPHAANAHQCCSVCAAAGALLAVAPAAVFAPAATLSIQVPLPSATPPLFVAAAAHRPRGPPLV